MRKNFPSSCSLSRFYSDIMRRRRWRWRRRRRSHLERERLIQDDDDERHMKLRRWGQTERDACAEKHTLTLFLFSLSFTLTHTKTHAQTLALKLLSNLFKKENKNKRCDIFSIFSSYFCFISVVCPLPGITSWIFFYQNDVSLAEKSSPNDTSFKVFIVLPGLWHTKSTPEKNINKNTKRFYQRITFILSF